MAGGGSALANAPTGSSPLPTHLHATIKAHVGPVHVARLNSHGRYVLTGGQDRSIHLFNVRNVSPPEGEGQKSLTPPIKTYASHSHPVTTLAIAPDDAHFASGGADRAVLVWDVASGSITRRFTCHVGAIHALAFGGASPAGDVLFAAGFDTRIRAYDMRAAGAWRPIMELKEATDAVMSIAVGPEHIYAGSVDGVARTYDLRMGALREDTCGDPIVSVTPSTTGASLLVSTLSSKASKAKHRLLDLSDGALLASFEGHSNASYRCRSSLCSADVAVVAGDEGGKVWAWDVVSGKEIRVSGGEVSHEKTVLWTEQSSAQGDATIVTAGADGIVKVWTDGAEAG